MQGIIVNSYPVLYTEFNAFCGIIVAILIYRTLKHGNSEMHRRFAYALEMALIWFACDNFWYLMDHHLIPGSWAASMILKSAYFLSGTFLCHELLLYFVSFSRSQEISHHPSFFGRIPVLLHIILLVVNVKTGILFTIAADLHYMRGPLFILQYILMYSYVVSAYPFGIRQLKHVHAYIEKERLRTLLLLPIIPACCGLYSFFFRYTLANPAGMTLCVLLTYMTFQDETVSVDSLTGLTNRRYLMNAIERKMERTPDSQYLLMLDINNFKKINDTYGHVQGDKALVRMADSLKKTAGSFEKRPIIARYGGDEFTVLLEGSEADVMRFSKKLNEELDRRNSEEDTPYCVQASVGWAVCGAGRKSRQAWIDEADKHLYEAKMTIHADI